MFSAAFHRRYTMRIGCLGVGNMGQPMAGKLLDAGYENFATMHLFPDTVLPRTFDFGATIEIPMKDVDLAIEQGEELGVPMWVSQAVRLVLKHAVFQGRAQQDMSRIVQIIEDGSRKA